ncbi:uncharacterized protein LOC123922585 [Trifolium pratense]|uniref:uncharacterized protein LOC123922585 n=1 Tax=Trifolium pratense TaxID=57577 RepID=UPI001E697166|nr:uncharacterized protein LOC123922585 [Trifolium pratense]
MASKLSFLNSLINRRNKPANNNSIKDDHINEDHLDIVKAAAWAWHQHGSGSCHEGEGSNEFYFRRSTTHRAPRPSRYKLELEAMTSTEKEATQSSTILHKEKSRSLLDAYEVQSISKQLNHLLESNNTRNRDKLVNSANNIASTSADDGVKEIKKKKKVRKGFFLKHSVICGREGDVVDPTSVSRDRRRQLTKSIPSNQGFK